MIRPFRPEDLDDILELEAEAFPKTPYEDRIFLTWYATLPPETFLVFYDEPSRKVAAYILYWPSGHIASVAVLPGFRRRGIGRRLVERALGCCGGVGRIEVRKGNSGAIEFYRCLGFFEVGEVPDYYKDEDALVMVKVER